MSHPHKLQMTGNGLEIEGAATLMDSQHAGAWPCLSIGGLCLTKLVQERYGQGTDLGILRLRIERIEEPTG